MGISRFVIIRGIVKKQRGENSRGRKCTRHLSSASLLAMVFSAVIIQEGPFTSAAT